MLLNIRTLYAIEALIRLSRASSEANTPSRGLIDHRRRRLLEPVLQELRASGIIKSHTGPYGGYRLCRPLYLISVGDVARCTENIEIPGRGRPRQLPRPRKATLPIRDRLEAGILSAFDRMPLSDYAETTEEPKPKPKPERTTDERSDLQTGP